MKRRMRMFVFVGVLVVTTVWAVSTAMSQPRGQSYAPANRAAIEKQLLDKEHSHITGASKGDVRAAFSDLASDAVAIDWNGVTKSSEFARLAPQIKTESQEIDQTQVLWVTPQVGAVIYRWTGKATYQGRAVPSPMFVTTIWANRGGQWVPIIHQYSGGGGPVDPVR